MTIDNDIDILLTKFFSGEALPEEAIYLEDWANASPENRTYFNHHSTIFTMNTDITLPDKNRTWGAIHDAIDQEQTHPITKTFNRKLAGIAAAVLLLLATGLLINHNLSKNSTIVYQAEAVEKHLVLQDKSAITVLPGSSITLNKAYGVTNRHLQLNGSASFSVIHNPEQEMIIDVRTLHVKDLGTKFTIVTAPGHDTISIRVDEGRIAVYDDFGSTGNASAGEKVTYLPLQKKLSVSPGTQVVTVILTQSVGTKANRDTTPGSGPVVIRDTLVKVYPDKPFPPCPPNPPPPPYPAVYPDHYPPDTGYTAEGKQAWKQKEAVRTECLVTDMLNDKLITVRAPLSFKLTNKAFIVNGQQQSDAIFQRYRKKYVPASNNDKDWAWSLNIDIRTDIDIQTKNQVNVQ